MRVAIGVLVLTQLLNLVLVPVFAHAGLTLSIGIGAMVNASWLLLGLIQRGTYRPEAGWIRLLLQVLFGCVLLAFFLAWANGHFDWIALRAHRLERIWLIALVLSSSAAIYFAAISVTGLKLRQLLQR
ncbi:putative peptidoglycan biosynthesis protein MurJ [mine drainage metagenome]|uniref:Putative peptidoglycan biosynthesis protein MurJ n=1 Tax=mine drainage metagenome TaxID=410659 RepID=A0A1J5P6V3_9ZZZZ